ncbi:hypothetical protein EDB92DRAFT_1829472 [Lactarius akahatsu]|uniref:DNA mismatch repair protein PMS1 n=1 Tax=Lactarius akahatsu TaxID=416441 RepID=A0AAD4LRT3_9AGAM|nr:hypothetical protein EDB92DRAFT_1829472 [Lactarius akahatsu]
MAMSDNATTSSGSNKAIKAIDSHSVHRITSGQVVIDLQTAAKELVENALDAGATNIEVRFKDYGLKSIEVIDNGSGIAPEDYESIALKHYTSKLASFSDLTSVLTFGFRGEALSSLCALSESVSVTTATSTQAPMGTVLTFDSAGRLTSHSGKIARQRGTTVAITGLFTPLPVRRKEFERHAKREFGKALHLLTAYALVPCTRENNGVVLTVSNTPDGGKKTAQLRTDGATSIRASVGALWGPKQLESLVDLRLSFEVVPEKVVLRRREEGDVRNHQIRVEGLISKFAPGAGRTGTDRQFFFINGRPCAPAKVQKAINEVYRTFNSNQSPFVIADFILPTDSCDINVSPDKRTILLHSENNLIESLKIALTEAFDNTRSSFVLNATQVALAQKERELFPAEEGGSASNEKLPLFIPDDQDDAIGTEQAGDITTGVQNGKIASKGDSVDLPVENEPDNTSPPSDEPHPVQKRPRSASPDPVSDEETRPIKKVASARSPSPELASVPAPSIAAPQRLAGPGRTPARVEQILSTNTSGTGRGVQMVLDTSGASWNLKPGHEGPQRKRPHLADVSASSSGKNARTSMRARLAGFARDGVHVVRDKEDEDSPEEEEGAGDKVVEVKRVSKKVDADDNDDDDDHCEAGEKVSSSTDVVDETMAVDPPDSQDSVPKSKPKSKTRHTPTGATASPSAKQSDAAELASGEELLLLEDSPSDSVPPSNAAASTSHDAASGVRTEVLRTIVGDAPPLAFSLERTTSAWSAYLERRAAPTPQPAPRSSDLEHADLAADNENATATLARVLSKADFRSMHVIGQFNRGFIVARLRKTDAAGAANDDLFIVDQHAADEKYNFETLQATTRLESQRLFTPRVLELTAADELVALENMSVLQQNGFEVAVEEDQPAGRRLSLVAQPVSKNTEFDTQDLEEILHLLRDRPAGTLVRSSKTRAMFAMRACRKSTMVGESLNAKQMTTIIRHMGTMEQPWNCPHGRPTMRHLSDVGTVEKREWRPMDWTTFIPR